MFTKAIFFTKLWGGTSCCYCLHGCGSWWNWKKTKKVNHCYIIQHYIITKSTTEFRHIIFHNKYISIIHVGYILKRHCFVGTSFLPQNDKALCHCIFDCKYNSEYITIQWFNISNTNNFLIFVQWIRNNRPLTLAVPSVCN